MRTILHCDMNNFYASVECLYQPGLRGRPVAVAGDPEQRRGIVLAKNDLAKRRGVRTGHPIWMAERLCPGLVLVPPHYDRYQRHSQLARTIYESYTDRVEAFGLDECWLDVTGSAGLFGDGRAIADAIRERIRFELGVTASVGVSFNKVFAKLGSDRQKPDATTCIPPEGWRDIVWPLPVSELLYAGPASVRTLARYSIRTIGELAKAPPRAVASWLGKCGTILQRYALGADSSPVAAADAPPVVKSVGNSTTMPRDLDDGPELRLILYILCESVAERLRELGLRCWTAQVSLRYADLSWRQRQMPLSEPCCHTGALFDAAYRLVRENAARPLRSVGVRACGLEHWSCVQTSLFPETIRCQKRDALEEAVDGIRRRFGQTSVRRGILLWDPALAALDPRADQLPGVAGHRP